MGSSILKLNTNKQQTLDAFPFVEKTSKCNTNA